MKVVLRRAALDDLEAIHAYVARDNVRAADRLTDRIRSRINNVAASGFGELGRPGRLRGTRELVHGSYVVTYRYDRDRDELVVLAVTHGARRR